MTKNTLLKRENNVPLVSKVFSDIPLEGTVLQRFSIHSWKLWGKYPTCYRYFGVFLSQKFCFLPSVMFLHEKRMFRIFSCIMYKSCLAYNNLYKTINNFERPLYVSLFSTSLGLSKFLKNRPHDSSIQDLTKGVFRDAQKCKGI